MSILLSNIQFTMFNTNQLITKRLNNIIQQFKNYILKIFYIILYYYYFKNSPQRWRGDIVDEFSSLKVAACSESFLDFEIQLPAIWEQEFTLNYKFHLDEPKRIKLQLVSTFSNVEYWVTGKKFSLCEKNLQIVSFLRFKTAKNNTHASLRTEKIEIISIAQKIKWVSNITLDRCLFDCMKSRAIFIFICIYSSGESGWMLF